MFRVGDHPSGLTNPVGWPGTTPAFTGSGDLIMFRFVSFGGRARVLLAGAGAVSTALTASAQSLLSEDFSSNPLGSTATVVGDTSRLAYDGTNHRLIASYDTGLPTTTVQFGLGQSLNQDDSFSFEVDFEIFSTGFFADNLGQIAFGLINQTTTGTDRAGGGPNFGDTFDIVTVDYFPFVTPAFETPTLTPTIFESDKGNGFFSEINSVFGPESGLGSEGPLPLDSAMTLTLTYVAGQGATLALNAGGSPVLINAGGGADGLTNTIQLDLSAVPDLEFEVDTFALTLFNDSAPFPADSTGVIADVAFERVSVDVVPEPASIALLFGSAALVLRRRRGDE